MSLALVASSPTFWLKLETASYHEGDLPKSRLEIWGAYKSPRDVLRFWKQKVMH
jgi:hypothetical protein